MDPLGPFSGPLRALLGGAQRTEQDIVRHSPLAETREELGDAVEAIHRAAESMERHVAVVETLAESVPALTESVNRLVVELNGLLGVLAPVAGAEREISRISHLFGRHRHEQAATAAAGAPSDPPSGQPTPAHPRPPA